MTTYINVLRDKGIECRENESMAQHTTFRAGGNARLAVFPKNREELLTALQAAKRQVPVVVLGNGSNVLFRDGGYKGAVIVTTALQSVTFSEPSADGSVTVTADCGVSLTGLARACGKRGLSGLEFAFGIPGTVGGAVFMNAGAYGGQMSDVVVQSDYYDGETGEVRQLNAAEHAFDYRFSRYMNAPHLTILGTRLVLRPDDPEAVTERMMINMESRKTKQPLEFPSAGSTFKRPSGRFVGQMTQECGLKGYTVGGAQLSEKHGGFVINRGGATAADLLAVMEHIERVILATYGVQLEREVRVLGEDG